MNKAAGPIGMAFDAERDLHWERDSYILKITNEVAMITLFKDDPVRREAADKQLRTIRRTEDNSDYCIRW